DGRRGRGGAGGRRRAGRARRRRLLRPRRARGGRRRRGAGAGAGLPAGGQPGRRGPDGLLHRHVLPVRLGGVGRRPAPGGRDDGRLRQQALFYALAVSMIVGAVLVTTATRRRVEIPAVEATARSA